MVEHDDGTVGVVTKSPVANKTKLGPFEAKRVLDMPFDDKDFYLKVISVSVKKKMGMIIRGRGLEFTLIKILQQRFIV